METWKGKSKQKPKPAPLQQMSLLDLFQRKPTQYEAQLHLPVVSPTTTNEECDGSATHAVTQLKRKPSMDYVLQRRDVSSPHTKPLHPFFAKKPLVESNYVDFLEDTKSTEVLGGSSNVTTVTEALPLLQDLGSQHDPIIVDSSPSKPTPTCVFTEDKLLAPIFAPQASNSRSILIRSSKLKEPAASYPERFMQHIRGSQGEFSSKVRYPRRFHDSAVTHNNSSTPTSSWNWTPEPSLPSARTQGTSSIPMLNQEAHLETIPEEHRRSHPAILRIVESHSMKTHLPPPNTTQPSPNVWADKWRPTCAAEVLGNEANALYLRDWLRALELQLNSSLNAVQPSGKGKGKGFIRGTKRPRVVRIVEKHRGRKKRKTDSDEDYDDNWIVASDAEVEEDTIPLDHVLRDPNLGVNPAPTNYLSHMSQHSFNSLTNTILLAGPPGTGKTAAAYACAQELDWEVFEVYPGIGRRNGANIENMVGDVGKNHLVRKSKARGGVSTTKGGDLFAALHRQYAAKELENAVWSEEDRNDGDFGFISRSVDESSNEETNDAIPIVRQSVILLEEVDILFRDDTGFWPAVINFIKHCKRPIICTCNDLSLVPTQDLPLQAIISFQPCPPPIATSYLQGLCSIEGYLVERSSLLQLYSSPSKLDPIDIPSSSIPPLCNEFPTYDLRRTINNLELWCTSSNSQQERIPLWESDHTLIEDLFDWGKITLTNRKIPTGSVAEQNHTDNGGIEGLPIHELAARHADLISFVDSNLTRSVSDTPSALAMRSLEASAEDEIGHPILYDPILTNKGIEFNGRGEEIASTILQSSRGVLEAGTTRRPTSIVKNSFRTHELFEARISHQLKIAEVIQGFVPPSMWAMARTTVYMDYLPCIRDIITTEDQDEIIFSQKERSGRNTRNSRGVYERAFAVTREVREALDSTILLG